MISIYLLLDFFKNQGVLTHPPAQLTIKGSRFYQPEQLLLFVLVGCSGYGEDAITSYIYSFQLLQLQ